MASVNTKLTFLKDIPILGDIFSRQSVLLIFAIAACILSWFILFKTPFGLRLRMVGENPKAASSMGIPVRRMKYIGVLVCGALAGLAGAYLSIDSLNMFVRDMSASRGYIAIAIAILSRYNPLSVLLCGSLFRFMFKATEFLRSWFK